jgi:SAM-dependent methyltransferase
MPRYLERFLEVFWLRPETAVWRALDCDALGDAPFERPSLDIGCGDGVFGFTRAGGRFELDYDAFSHAGHLDQFFVGEDIYNFYDASKRLPIIAEVPRYKIDWGLDHKSALLEKAKLTGLYENLIEGDANTPLPFASESFRTVYSNILYWLEDFPTTLRQVRRVLHPRGKCVLQVPSETFKDYSFYQRLHVRTGDPEWAWLSLIDRGRSDNIKYTKSQKEWTSEFESAGLQVDRCTRYLPKLVLEAWDIGLRPISPVLIEMANSLAAERRRELKRKWIANLMPLLDPLCRLPSDPKHPGGFFLFELSRRD